MSGHLFCFDQDKDYYWILRVHPSVSQAEIYQSYCNLIKRTHPAYIKNWRNAHWMRVIDEAYRVLSNPTLRASYDQFRKSYMTPLLVGEFFAHPSDLAEPEPEKEKAQYSQTPPSGSTRSALIFPGVLLGFLPLIAVILAANTAFYDLVIIGGGCRRFAVRRI